MRSNMGRDGKNSHILSAWIREDGNTTQNKRAAQNLNINRKWSLSSLKMIEIIRTNISIKKHFVINMNTLGFLVQVVNF